MKVGLPLLLHHVQTSMKIIVGRNSLLPWIRAITIHVCTSMPCYHGWWRMTTTSVVDGYLTSRQCLQLFLQIRLPFIGQTLLSLSQASPNSKMAWDMWIECTMKKGSRMKSAIIQNEKQL